MAASYPLRDDNARNLQDTAMRMQVQLQNLHKLRSLSNHLLWFCRKLLSPSFLPDCSLGTPESPHDDQLTSLQQQKKAIGLLLQPSASEG